jgi:hypothetical protein
MMLTSNCCSISRNFRRSGERKMLSRLRIQHLAERAETLLAALVARPERADEDVARRLGEVDLAGQQPLQDGPDAADLGDRLVRDVNHSAHANGPSFSVRFPDFRKPDTPRGRTLPASGAESGAVYCDGPLPRQRRSLDRPVRRTDRSASRRLPSASAARSAAARSA